ncbi:MAG: CopG family transcriptional regulator [Deltaproteobacteria bacterium]|nr:CopG family transcriptional regulator [Deltaproteobacteria bacterium]
MVDTIETQLEQHINITAKNLGLTKSELIRKSISEYLGNLNSPSPWKLGKDYFGRYSSGLDNLSADRKEIIKNKIKAKRR